MHSTMYSPPMSTVPRRFISRNKSVMSFIAIARGKIKDALRKFKDVKFAAQLPAFMKQYEEYEQIRQKSVELKNYRKPSHKKSTLM